MESKVFNSFWPQLLFQVTDPGIPIGFKLDGSGLAMFGGGVLSCCNPCATYSFNKGNSVVMIEISSMFSKGVV